MISWELDGAIVPVLVGCPVNDMKAMDGSFVQRGKCEGRENDVWEHGNRRTEDTGCRPQSPHELHYGLARAVRSLSYVA